MRSGSRSLVALDQVLARMDDRDEILAVRDAEVAMAERENEANVAALLDAEPRAELCAVEFPGVPSMPGVTQWRSQQFGAQLQLTLRVLPDSVWDGFFVAKLRKSG